MADLACVALDEEGRSLSREYLETLYFSTLDYEPLRNAALEVAVGDERVTLAPPPEPFQGSMVFPVKGFGSLYVYADNEGKGFTGEEKEIDFGFEAAKTRIAKVRRWIEEAGFAPSSEVEERMQEAARLLKAAEAARAGSRERASAALDSLRESLSAGELAVLEKARQDIADRGWREGFRFGCALYRRPSPGKGELFLGLLNFATLVLHWTTFEPRQGEKDWKTKDDLASWLRENNIAMKGHPLMFMHSSSGYGMPDWVRRIDYRDPETFKPLVRDRAYEIVEHYRGTVDMFDVINEAHDWSNIFDYSQEQLIDLTQFMCDITRKANPEAIRVVNTLFEWGQYVAIDATLTRVFEETGSPYRTSSRPLMSAYEYLERCLKANIDFEVVGLQFHEPTQDLFEINLLLDRFARLDKAIHITELGIPSSPGYIKRGLPGWWRCYHRYGPWTEQIQADAIEQLYTLCYSKPYVTAVTSWSLDDRGLGNHSGFLRSDLTPKESYQRLKNLVEGWNLMRQR